MSKKGRRERTPNLPPEAFNAPAAPATPATPAPSAAASAAGSGPGATAPSGRKAAAASATSASVNWQAEYGEVLGDLRRTFLIFIGLIVVMILLSFVIR
jgi:hypothetical protein